MLLKGGNGETVVGVLEISVRLHINLEKGSLLIDYCALEQAVLCCRFGICLELPCFKSQGA
jgi:hypothetical protein